MAASTVEAAIPEPFDFALGVGYDLLPERGLFS